MSIFGGLAMDHRPLRKSGDSPMRGEIVWLRGSPGSFDGAQNRSKRTSTAEVALGKRRPEARNKNRQKKFAQSQFCDSSSEGEFDKPWVSGRCRRQRLAWLLSLD